MDNSEWYLYIVRCSDDSLYTGITKDVERRLEEHNSDNLLGARYTRARRPVVLVYREVFRGHSQAAKREYEIKKMSRKAKVRLIEKGEKW